MKRFKLGFTIGVLGAVVLFGMTSQQGEANAEQPERVAANRAEENPTAPAAAKIADIHASLAVKASAAPAGLAPLADGGSCPKGMVEVLGDYCPYLEQKCLRWLDPEKKMQCAEFAPTSECQGKTSKKHFCIDQFEYPNRAGEKPVVMTSWNQAKASCEKDGKRLCGESEWTLACEGQERLPYPYGYARNADACNIDKPHPDVDEKAFANPRTRDAEAARLDQRDASGTREACVSPYGVYDMTGNVDEWVVNEGGKPYKSGLKGGYWGPVRDRCRPMTIAHNEEFSFYQIGFRCCSDTDSSKASKSRGEPGNGGPSAPIGGPASGSQGTVLTDS